MDVPLRAGAFAFCRSLYIHVIEIPRGGGGVAEEPNPHPYPNGKYRRLNTHRII